MSNTKDGKYAYNGLDRLIHEKARLSVMSSLVVNGSGLLFNDLKSLCSLTDGNLSRHIQHLREEGLVELWKGFRNKRPQTICRITSEGKERFIKYLNELESVLKDTSSFRLEKNTKTYNITDNDGWIAI